MNCGWRPGPDRGHGGLQGLGDLGLGLGGHAGGRIGVLHARPVAPQQVALGVVGRRGRRLGLLMGGDRVAAADRRDAQPRAREERALVSIPSCVPPPGLFRGVFAPRHETYQSVEIVRGASGALSTGRHGLEALDGVVQQHGLALLPARVPGLAVVDQRRARAGDRVAGLAGLAVQRRQPGVGRGQRQGLLGRRRGRDGLGTRPPGPGSGPGRPPRGRTIRRSRSGAWRR